MHRLLVLYSEPTDRAAFEEYYVNTHLPLARKLPGMKAAQYSFGLAALGPSGTESPYFAVFEGDFDSPADLAAAVSSPEGQALLADEANFATGGAVVVYYPVEPLFG